MTKAMDTSVPVPAHLRRYVVEQNYAAYTARDQAVWRFVLLQTHARLLRTAHPAYGAGFAAAGIEVDRIPNIARMGDRLEFRTVCVDGFIPPRAFQAFQARGVLPIAADIRTAEHLAYTPAPDIIHEAAGHAPFLADPEYARFLRKVGTVSEHAFESAYDRRLYDAIHLLSELKEDPSSSAEQVQRAEAQLGRVKAQSARISEATRMARLYWWTVEYGLVGTLTDYRLYGAGLLSSIGEAHFCQDPSVQKRWLDASCIDVDYDITRAQPQLFVARSFGDLERVLDDVARGLSQRVGGAEALREAQLSEAVATLVLPSGLAISGVVRSFSSDHVELTGRCRLSRNGQLLESVPELDGYWLPLRAGSVEQLRACELQRAGRLQLGEDVYPWLLADRVVSASAAAPEGFYPPTPFAGTTIPKPRSFADAERRLIDMHEQVATLMHERVGSRALVPLRAMHRELELNHAQEWLLRWNLLEALIAAGESRDPLACTLNDDLERLELRYGHREPIATGLAQLRALVNETQGGSA
jgi:phenylalanine-4-hydroxylase